MKKRGWIICCLCVLFLVLSGCGRQEQPGITDEEPDEERIEIGITFDSFVIERWQRDRDVFVAAAQEMGANVNVQNANGSIEEQISQIEYFPSPVCSLYRL